VGGNPSTINQIRAYIRLQDATKNLKPEEVDLTRLANGDYCWAIIYYLLRSGFVNEAAQYVKDNKSALTAIDRRFIIYMNSFHISPDRRLSRKEQDSMSNDYQQKLRLSPENTLDPYRMAVYKIVGRCDLSKRSIDSISQTVDDWIWLQFALARESNRMEEVAAEVYGLDNVRETIREIGQKHFTRGSESNKNFGTYFYLQILGGMFESAVAYLYTHSYVSAVHFAIALDYYGLIRVADFNASETEFRK
jgi:nuclear pore complex protein Nup93